jgi:hypothetical protein
VTERMTAALCNDTNRKRDDLASTGMYVVRVSGELMEANRNKFSWRILR